MKLVLLKSAVLQRAGLVTACVVMVLTTQLVGAGKVPMKVLKYDPTAEKMQMFDAIEEGALKVRVIAHDAKGGNMFFENLSGKPLTIELPQALATVHVLKQFGGGMGGMGGGMGGMGGGGMGGMGGGGMGGGGGFFSIPAERVAQVPFKSVCLNHGKPDPSPRMTYIPVRLDLAVKDKVLQEMLRMYGTGSLDFTVAQAAAWHITDNMSWEQLASKKEYTLPGVYSSQVPTFSIAQLQAAQELLTVAAKRAEERAKSEPETKSEPVRIRKSGQTAKPSPAKTDAKQEKSSKTTTK